MQGAHDVGAFFYTVRIFMRIVRHRLDPSADQY